MRRRSLSLIRCAGSDTRGAVMVLMAAFLPVAVLFCGFVIDIANWYEHKRHLQTQADAAALAAAGSFMSCPDNQPILDKAAEYGGDRWNAQVGGTQEDVHMLINSKTYYDQPTKTDSTVREGDPCDAKMVDVKLTETDLPWWFELGNVDYINAHARVEINEVDTLSGAVPFGVPDVNPKKAKVWFVDEDNPGQVLQLADGSPAETFLTRKGYADGRAVWDNSGADGDPTALPIDVKIDRARIGVRVALSGSDSTTCGDPLVECYDLSSETYGLVHVRGFGTDPVPSGGAPRPRDVRLTPGSCGDGYFTSEATETATECLIGVRAQVDFDGSAPEVWASVPGRNTNYKLEPDPDSPGWWFADGVLPVDPAAGRVPVELKYKDSNTCSKGQPCSLGEVHRAYSANGDSGPIKLAQVFENTLDGPEFGVNSWERCSATNTDCTRELVVKLGIQGTFQDLYEDLENVTEPVTLRFTGGGSQNQTLDCDPWAEDGGGGVRTLVNEIGYGCRPAYTKNKGTVCPANLAELQGTSTSTADQGEPWQCVANETGGKEGALSRGMTLRILGSETATECPEDLQNKWPEKPPPRVIHLFLTQFGAFGGQGQETVPITGFATFYVTGWSGQGNNQSPCPSPPDDPVAEKATVVGHFIKYIGPIDGAAGSQPCDFDGPSPCTAVLTE